MDKITESRRRILTVGAYQMDNFGDSLLLLVTEHYLRKADVTAAGAMESRFSTDMVPLLGREIPGYGKLLTTQKFDLVWTVGGELSAGLALNGGDVNYAFWMSARDEIYEEYQRDPNKRQKILSSALGGIKVAHPQIPSVFDYPLNRNVTTVVNSAGLSNILDIRNDRKDEVKNLLRSLDFISVRDKTSSALLRSLEIEHELVPDAVHAISVCIPKSPSTGRETVVFQISGHLLDRLGIDMVGDTLAASSELKNLRTIIVASGQIGRTRDVDKCAKLCERVKSQAPWLDIEILGSRRPLDIVDTIRSAKLVVGTSLHVRIVAAAYKIPRVGLMDFNPKVASYIHLWDSMMPHDVPLGLLDQAISRAQALSADPWVIAQAEALTTMAHRNLQKLARRFPETLVAPDDSTVM